MLASNCKLTLLPFVIIVTKGDACGEMLGVYRIPSFFLIIILPFSFMKIENSCLKPSLLRWLPNGRFSNLINSSTYISWNFTLRKCFSFSVYLFMTHWTLSYNPFSSFILLLKLSELWALVPVPIILWATSWFSVRTGCSIWAQLVLSLPQLYNRPLLQGALLLQNGIYRAFWGEDAPISSLSHGFLMIDEE